MQQDLIGKDDLEGALAVKKEIEKLTADSTYANDAELRQFLIGTQWEFETK